MNVDVTLGLAAGTGMAVLMVFLGSIAAVQRARVPVERLHTYVAQLGRGTQEGPEAVGLLADLDGWLKRQSFGTDIARNLARADIKLTVTEFLLLHGALFAVGLLAGSLFFGSAVAGVVAACAGLLLPQVYVSSAQRKRMQAFNEQLPGALSSFANALRGGYGLVQALSLVASELSPPISTEFQRVVTEVGYGLPYDTAFQNMLRRNPSSDLSLVVTAIEIHLEMGGNLSQILDNISDIIRDRVRIQGQIRAYTAQQRFSAIVLTGLPFGLAGMIYMVNRSYLTVLWTTQLGLVMLVLALTMLLVGAMMLSKISRIDV